ncbi:hypothetical protein P6U16_21030 [Rhizobium sp. 32-5/1]|uniref:hypothetical protein n=1 Tax=Rhizobium sp. 32-5/1 TaxID=3019602 RepID=UPI00240DE584|nr:hypothetical protein [Rhizobium sp. 32-5/1]WEZ83286.1 hypothetical protein P6U16_21030 [Rhizobium sp. 32-5/1]
MPFPPARREPISLVERYTAYIGQDDLYNSYDERLWEPWQIIRQDRANYHRYGVFQPGDEGDAFFASAKNRERAERMIQFGTIDRAAAAALVQGDVLIDVKIYRGPDGDYLDITVD